MKTFYFLILLLISNLVFSQQKITLNECYSLLNKNYPLAKQHDLLQQKNELDVAVIEKGKLPKLDLLLQVSYQSDVTKTPFMTPESGIEPPNLDQYKANLSVNQLIYAGNKIKASTNLKSIESQASHKQLEVTLYQLKKQVNQLYFSILNLQERKKLLKAKHIQLNAKLHEVKAGVKYGTLPQNSDSFIEVELLKLEQQFIALDFNKLNLIETLGELIGIEINSSTTIENPTITTNYLNKIQRPELELFNIKKNQIDASEKLISKQNTPQIVGFATGGFGNPGLNMLENAFKEYYWVGVKMNWNVFDWNTSKKLRESLLINKDIIDNEAEIFNLNTTIELTQQNSEIKKLNAFIDADISIIDLQKKILKTTESQLKNGVLKTSDYVTELTNLYEAENNLNTHKIELLLAKANYNVTKGN